MANFINTHPYRTILSALLGLLVVFGILAGWRSAKKPSLRAQGGHAGLSLQKVASQFISNQQELLQKSRRLKDRLQNELERNAPNQQLYKTLQRFTQFWGVALYRGKEPVVWQGFSSMPSILHASEKKAQVTIEKDGNVMVWLARINFKVGTAHKPELYHLFTARRIKQHNALSIGSSKDYSMLQEISTGSTLNRNRAIIIAKPLPKQYTDYHILRSLSGDSVGVAVAKNTSAPHIGSHWKQMNGFWEGVYFLICLIVIGVLLYFWAVDFPAVPALLLQTLVLGIAWFVVYQLNIAENGLPVLFNGKHPQNLQSYQDLFHLFIYGIFLLFFAYSLKRQLKRMKFRFDSNSILSVITAAIAAGIVNAVVIAFVFSFSYHLTYHTTIPLLTLWVFPAAGTLLFYLCIGILFLALTNVIYALNRFLLQIFKDYTKLVSIICCFSFFVVISIQSYYGLMRPFTSWVFYISLIYFGLIFLLVNLSFYKRLSFYRISPFRMAALYSFIIALAGCTIMYQAEKDHLDVDLQKAVHKYTTKKDPQR